MDKGNFIGMAGGSDYGPDDYDYGGNRAFKEVFEINSPQAVST